MSKKQPKSDPALATAPDHARAADRLGLERLIFFSDAVFAIAITLLALDIRLPVEADTLSGPELLRTLVALWPKYLSYATSFVVIGLFWMSHHRKFRYIERYDTYLLLLNLLLLLVVAFIPFPTAVVSETVNQVSVSFYALSIVAVGLLSGGVWWYAAYRYRLIDRQLVGARWQRELWQPVLAPLLFGLSIGVAVFNPTAAMVSWLLLLPGFILLHF